MGDEVRQPFVRSSGSPRVVESGGYIINVSLLSLSGGSLSLVTGPYLWRSFLLQALRGEPFTLSTKNPIPLPDVVFPTGTVSRLSYLDHLWHALIGSSLS